MTLIRCSSLAIALFGLSMMSSWFAINAQSINITGSVVDNGTSAGIANAKVALIEFPSCTTRTDANGGFTLSDIVSATRPQAVPGISESKVALSGNHLWVSTTSQPVGIMVDVFTILGEQLLHEKKLSTGLTEFSSLWKAPGLYYVRVQVGNEVRILNSFSAQRTITLPSSSNNAPKPLAKTAAAYTIEAGKSGYDSKQASLSSTTGASVVIRLSTYSQAPGTWKEVTTDPIMKSGYGGIISVRFDPVRKSDAWVGCVTQGFWKSTDYGLTWKKVNTGTNGDQLNTGRPYFIAIDENPNRDPATSPTLYTIQGYGAGGVWKSTDGGVNWNNVFNNNAYEPDGVTKIDPGQTTLAPIIPNMCGKSGPNHLITTLYYTIGVNTGIFETTDGGAKWVVHRTPLFTFANHQDVPFAIDSSTWCVIKNSANHECYRTTDCGNTWALVGNLNYNCDNPLVIGSKVYIGSVTSGLFRSNDMGASWKTLREDFCGWVVASATKLYVCNSLYVSGGGGLWLSSAPLSNDSAWTKVPGTDTPSNYTPTGGASSFDGTHWIILGAQSSMGVWRYVEP